ncbi:MAG: flagellin, partial [Gammaproteobacteria bacterium]|nr:flagellin [Gammaproteobacteria bacterium]
TINSASPITLTDANDSTTARGQVQIESAGAFQVSASAADMVGASQLAVSKLSSVADIDISSQDGAQSAVSVIDAAMASIDKNRASLGAIQNRFENTISNLQNISENVSAARGRIRDTDFAAETANLSKNQILQQAGTAILAQANQLPQAVLSLLR